MPAGSVDKKGAVMVTVTTSALEFHNPPEGATTAPVSPFVRSRDPGAVPSRNVRIHLDGKAAESVNVAINMAGNCVLNVNARFGGADTTTGGDVSASAAARSALGTLSS